MNTHARWWLLRQSGAGALEAGNRVHVIVFFAHPPSRALALASPDGLSHAVILLRAITVDAFTPALAWMFARDFPRTLESRASARAVTLAIRASVAAALFLIAVNLVIAVRGDAGVVAYFDRNDPFGHYWTVCFGLLVPIAPFILWRMHHAPPDERRRVRLFGVGIAAVGIFPVLLAVVPPWFPVLEEKVHGDLGATVLVPLNLLLILAMAGTTAYSVAVQRVLDVRTVLRKAAQYGLARLAVGVLVALPLVFVGIEIYRVRGERIASLFEARRLLWFAMAAGSPAPECRDRPDLLSRALRRARRAPRPDEDCRERRSDRRLVQAADRRDRRGIPPREHRAAVRADRRGRVRAGRWSGPPPAARLTPGAKARGAARSDQGSKPGRAPRFASPRRAGLAGGRGHRSAGTAPRLRGVARGRPDAGPEAERGSVFPPGSPDPRDSRRIARDQRGEPAATRVCGPSPARSVFRGSRFGMHPLRSCEPTPCRSLRGLRRRDAGGLAAERVVRKVPRRGEDRARWNGRGLPRDRRLARAERRAEDATRSESGGCASPASRSADDGGDHAPEPGADPRRRDVAGNADPRAGVSRQRHPGAAARVRSTRARGSAGAHPLDGARAGEDPPGGDSASRREAEQHRIHGRWRAEAARLRSGADRRRGDLRHGHHVRPAAQRNRLRRNAPLHVPEAFDTARLGASFDLWSLSVVALEAASGKHPLERQTSAETLQAIRRGFDDERRAWLPAWRVPVGDLFARFLSRDPGRRPSSAAEMAEWIAEVESSRVG